MEWFYPKRRGPEWKHGWTGQTLASVSAPPLHLLTIFAIVIALLWLSQYTEYKAQMQDKASNFQLFLMLLPIFLIFLVASNSSSIGWFNFRLQRGQHESTHRVGGSPWGVALLVVLLLVLLSYQSSFHSKWFGPLWRSCLVWSLWACIWRNMMNLYMKKSFSMSNLEATGTHTTTTTRNSS